MCSIQSRYSWLCDCECDHVKQVEDTTNDSELEAKAIEAERAAAELEASGLRKAIARMNEELAELQTQHSQLNSVR